jgi:hypothetical protein
MVAMIGRIALAGAVALAPAVSNAAAPTPAAVTLMPERGQAPPRTEAAPDPTVVPRKALIAGTIVAGSGLVLGSIGFAVFGGIHAGNPGPGLSLVSGDSSTDAERQRLVRLARATEGIAYTGVALMLTGGVIAAIAGAKLRQARRGRAQAMLVVPGLASLSVSGRF